MKKNRLSFLIVSSLLAISALAGCEANKPQEGSKADDTSTSVYTSNDSGTSDGGQSSSNAGSQNPSSDGGQGSSDGGGQQVKTDWTDQEKQVMMSHLHNIVLPFVDMDVRVDYNRDHDEVIIESYMNMGTGFLRSYMEKYVEEDSPWEGGDVSYELGLVNGCAYAFRRPVVQNSKKYYVTVFFCGVNDAGYDPAGKFHLEASDPYQYEFPTNFINDWIRENYGSNVDIPGFEADYYNLDYEGILYAGSQTNLEDSYKAALIATGTFTIDERRDSDGYLIARPNDGAYILKFKYDADSKEMILTVDESNGWNSTKVANFFLKNNQPAVNIPPLNIEGAKYQFTESNEYGVVLAKYTISGSAVTLEAFQNYIVTCRNTGFVANPKFDDNSYTLSKMIAEDNLYFVYLDYYQTGNTKSIEIEFPVTGQSGTHRLFAYPASEISQFLAGVTDQLPELNPLNAGFEININGDVLGLVIHTDTVIAEGAISTFTGQLTRGGYTPNGVYYISPNNQLKVSAYHEAQGVEDLIFLRVEKITAPEPTAWPSTDIANLINGLGSNITDTLPVLDVSSAEECNVSDTYREVRIEGIGASYKATAEAALKDAGYLYNPYYYIGVGRNGAFISPNKQFAVEVYVSDDGHDVMLALLAYWPMDYKVVGLGGNWNYSDSLLFFVDATVQSEVDDGWYVTQLKVEFDVNVNDEFKVTDGGDWLGIDKLEENANFSRGDEGNIKANAKGHVVLYLKTFANGSKGIAINFTPDTPVLGPWPEEELNDFFGETFASIPEIKIADASYAVYDTVDTKSIKAMYITVTVENAADAQTAAIQELCNQFGYSDNGTGAYISSNDDLPVYVFSTVEGNSFLVGVCYFSTSINTWENAKAEMEAELSEGKTIPDFSVDGAISYEFNGTIDITFPDDADMDAMVAAVKTKIQAEGYHYSKRFMQYVNAGTDLSINVTLSDEHVISVAVNEQAFEDDSGYGIILIGYDSEGGYYYLNTEEIGSPNPEKTNEYMVLEVEFSVGDRFCIYDFTNETEFNVTIDEASLGSNFRNYFEYDSASGSYLVKQAFTGDIYIKLIYGGDQVYIGFTPNP